MIWEDTVFFLERTIADDWILPNKTEITSAGSKNLDIAMIRNIGSNTFGAAQSETMF